MISILNVTAYRIANNGEFLANLSQENFPIAALLREHALLNQDKRSEEVLLQYCMSNLPRVMNMKRMFVPKRDGSLMLLPKVGVTEWAKQMHNLETILALCNRRNSASNIRLL